ncbi:MAG: TetR/AcrR family transcriptional regulator [Chitinispirillaceae bacterium]
MKKTFLKIPAPKREAIIKACIEEFGASGYEQGSTDRIIKKAGISKGGLYEYISSKKELFLFIVDHVYSSLYDYIQEHIRRDKLTLPSDILQRFRLVSGIAIDFYLEYPDMIAFIVKCGSLQDLQLKSEVHKTFLHRFNQVFSNLSSSGLAFPKEIIMDLLIWLLIKTRNDFMLKLSGSTNREALKQEYLNEWELLLGILENGIYSTHAAKENTDDSRS